MEEKSIVKIYNGVIVNDLCRIDISQCHPNKIPKDPLPQPPPKPPKPLIKLPKLNAIMKTLTLETENLKLSIQLPKNKDFSKMVFRASVWKLLDFLIIKFTEKNSHECPKEKS